MFSMLLFYSIYSFYRLKDNVKIIWIQRNYFPKRRRKKIPYIKKRLYKTPRWKKSVKYLKRKTVITRYFIRGVTLSLFPFFIFLKWNFFTLADFELRTIGFFIFMSFVWIWYRGLYYRTFRKGLREVTKTTRILRRWYRRQRRNVYKLADMRRYRTKVPRYVKWKIKKMLPILGTIRRFTVLGFIYSYQLYVFINFVNFFSKCPSHPDFVHNILDLCVAFSFMLFICSLRYRKRRRWHRRRIYFWTYNKLQFFALAMIFYHIAVLLFIMFAYYSYFFLLYKGFVPKLLYPDWWEPHTFYVTFAQFDTSRYDHWANTSNLFDFVSFFKFCQRCSYFCSFDNFANPPGHLWMENSDDFFGYSTLHHYTVPLNTIYATM